MNIVLLFLHFNPKRIPFFIAFINTLLDDYQVFNYFTSLIIFNFQFLVIILIILVNQFN